VFLGTLPEKITIGKVSEKTSLRTFFALFRNPSLRVVDDLCRNWNVWAVSGLHLAAHVSLRQIRAGNGPSRVEASVFPQIGTASGLLLGGALADYGGRRTKASRFWGRERGLSAGRSLHLLHWRRHYRRMDAIGFDWFWILYWFCDWESSCVCVRCGAGVVSRIGGRRVKSGCRLLVSGFAPFLGGLSRREPSASTA